jgi:hypothetical protein
LQAPFKRVFKVVDNQTVYAVDIINAYSYSASILFNQTQTGSKINGFFFD